MGLFQRVDVVEDPDLAAMYAEIVEYGFGTDRPMNWFTAFGARPDLLRAAWGLVKGVLVGGELPATLKQMIVLAISIDADCSYCRIAHTGALQALGVPDPVVQQCARDPDTAQIPELHKAMIRYARKAARTPSAVTQADADVLRALGVTDSELMELTMLAAFTNFINTWADAARLDVDG